MTGELWFAISVAVGVPLGLWLRGRAVAQHLGQPLFAERWWAFRRLGTFVVAFGCALLAISFATKTGSTAQMALAYAVFATGCLVVWYVLRRRVFAETWSFGRFVAFRARVFVAFGGFWLLLFLLPLWLPTQGAVKWPVTLIVALVLLLWSHFYPAVTSWILRAKRIDDPLIQSDFQHLVAKMSIDVPTLYRVDCGGGVFPNAFALPSRRDGRVIFFSTVLDRFSHTEVVGVLAHELAHFEQFDRRVLRRSSLVSTSLILLGTLGAALLTEWMEFGPTASVLWVVAALGSLGLLMRGRQKRETLSDARAVELTGDPQSMISALTKLHSLAHLPSEWDESSETTISHPALVRRIAAIRHSTQTTPALETAVVVPARASGSFLVFDRERLRYLTGVPAHVEPDAASLVQHADRLQSFTYTKLTRLTVEPDAKGALLVLRETSGATRIAIADEVIPELNALVARISIAGPEARAAFADPGRLRLLVTAGALIALLANSILIVLIQWLLALGRPMAGSAAAMAAALIVAALYLATAPDGPFWAVVALVAAGASLSWTYRRARQTADETRSVLVGSAILSLWTLLGFLLIALAGREPIRVAETVARIPMAVAAPVSLGAFLLAARRRTRWAPFACLLLMATAGGTALLGTTWFVDRFSIDPLLSTRHGVKAIEFTRGDAYLTLVGSSPLTESYDEVRVSPGGAAFAALAWCEDDAGYEGCDARDVLVGDASGWTRKLRAADLYFADEETLVLLETHAESAIVKTETLRGGDQPWYVRLPSLSSARFQIDVDSGNWVVVAYADDEMSRFEGKVGSAALVSRAWRTDDESAGYTQWSTASTDARIGNRVDFASQTQLVLQRTSWHWLLPFALTRPNVDLIRRSHSSTEWIASSALDVTCADSEPTRSDVACMAGESNRTHFWRINPTTGRMAPSGWIPGRVHAVLQSSSGQRFAALLDGKWRLIDVNARRSLSLDFPDEEVYQIAVSERAVAAVRRRDDKSEITLYRLEDR